MKMEQLERARQGRDAICRARSAEDTGPAAVAAQAAAPGVDVIHDVKRAPKARKGNPSNVGPIFHVTASGGATSESLNGKTILGAPYAKPLRGICHIDHRQHSGRWNDRAHVAGSDETPV